MGLHSESIHEISVLIEYIISKGSDQTVHMHRFAKAFAACTHKVGM